MLPMRTKAVDGILKVEYHIKDRARDRGVQLPPSAFDWNAGKGFGELGPVVPLHMRRPGIAEYTVNFRLADLAACADGATGRAFSVADVVLHELKID